MKYRTLWIIVSCAVALRLMVFVALQSQHDEQVFWMGDTVGYVQLAHNIVAGNGFSMATTSPYVPDGMRTPVLPYLLALTLLITGSVIPYVFVQIVLAGILIFLSYKIAQLVTGSEKAALIVALCAAFEPYSLFVQMSLLTETIFATLFLGGVYAMCLYVRDRDARMLALAASIFAVSALTRPIAQFMPLVLCIVVMGTVSWRSYAKHIAIVLVAFFAVLSPWMIRNYVHFGSVAISSGGYQNVYSDLGATIISYRDHVEWYVVKQRLNEDFAVRHNVPLDALQQDPALSPILLREGVGIMISNPVATAKAFVTVGIAFLTNDIWTYYPQYWGWMSRFQYGFSPTHVLVSEGPVAVIKALFGAAHGVALSVAIFGRFFWVCMSGLFFLGCFALFSEKGARRIYGILFFSIVLYMLALCLSNGAGINGRYRYPLNSIFYIGAICAVQFAWRSGMVMFKRSSRI